MGAIRLLAADVEINMRIDFYIPPRLNSPPPGCTDFPAEASKVLEATLPFLLSY